MTEANIGDTTTRRARRPTATTGTIVNTTTRRARRPTATTGTIVNTTTRRARRPTATTGTIGDITKKNSARTATTLDGITKETLTGRVNEATTPADTNTLTLTIECFNCHGFMESVDYILSRLHNVNFMCLSETWVKPSEPDLIQNIINQHEISKHNKYVVFSKFGMDEEDEFLSGRPYGGVAIICKVLDNISYETITCNTRVTNWGKAGLGWRPARPTTVYQGFSKNRHNPVMVYMI